MRLVQNAQSQPTPSRQIKLLDRLKDPWHRYALLGYMIIVLGHWAEHVLQAMQVYLFHWPRPHAHGALGLAAPWLVTSEWLHYGYALAMLIGLIICFQTHGNCHVAASLPSAAETWIAQCTCAHGYWRDRQVVEA